MTDTKKGLGNQIVKGSFWIIALEVSNQGLQFLKTFYAARLLTPADFGIVGFAFLIIAFIDIISTTGMKEAIIQRSDDLTGYLDTVWLTEFFKGLLVLIITWFSAPLLSTAFASSHASLTSDVVRFIGVIYFTQCCTSIGVVYFEKHIEFHKFFIYQFSGTLVDVVVSVVLVSYRHDVWGLFYGVLAGTATRVVFSFILVNYRPRLTWSFAKARELLQYGKWILKNRIFSFFGLQSDSIIVSALYSLTSLGVYQMAFRIGNLPISQLSNIVGRLAFPTFSKLQDEPEKLKQYFLNSINVLTVLFLPVIILIFLLIPEFTGLMLGMKWAEITPIVRILIISGFLRVYMALIDSYFSAVGKPKEGSNMQMLRFISFAAVVFPLGYWLGIKGVAFSGLVSLIFVVVLFARKTSRQLNISGRELLQIVAYPLLFGCGVTSVMFFVKERIDGTTFLGFGILVVIALGIYAGLSWIINKYTRVKLLERIYSMIKP